MDPADEMAAKIEPTEHQSAGAVAAGRTSAPRPSGAALRFRQSGTDNGGAQECGEAALEEEPGRREEQSAPGDTTPAEYPDHLAIIESTTIEVVKPAYASQ
jgi:hypothetical protein